MNVYMDPGTRQMLAEFAKSRRLSESAAIRMLVARAYSDMRRTDSQQQAN